MRVQDLASGTLESVIAVSRARVRKGDVSRPKRSGGRVTATNEKNERPEPPVSDEGGRGNTEAAAVHKAGEERRFGATPATATPVTSSQTL